MSDPDLTLFLSHSSVDAGLAKALVELIEKALKLPARQIRCTSVDGYRLPAGSNTDQQLRQEVFEAKVLIGLVTPSSLKSAYVSFELGARWGAGKHLVPVLARGASASSLSGPIAGINSLTLGSRNQVLQVVEDLAAYLKLQLEPLSSFQAAVDAVVEAAAFEAEKEPQSITPAPSSVLTGEELRALEYLASIPDDETAERVGEHLKVNEQKAKFVLVELQTKRLVAASPIVYGIVTYSITQRGRAELVRRNLL